MTAFVKKIAKRRANREDTEEVDSKRVTYRLRELRRVFIFGHIAWYHL